MLREMVAAEIGSLNAEAIALQDAVARLRFTIAHRHIPPAGMDQLYIAFATFALHAEGMMTGISPEDVHALATAAVTGFLTRLDRVFDPPAAAELDPLQDDPFTPDGASWAP